jgi:hypothetical protein
MWVYILIVILIIIVLIFLFLYLLSANEVGSDWVSKVHTYNELNEKCNHYVEDLMNFINEDRYFVIFSNESRIINRNIYLNVEGKTDREAYKEINGLLAADLSKKYDDRDVKSVYEKLKQVGHTLGYLTTSISPQ